MAPGEGSNVDWATFLADWKSGYRPGMDRVNRGEWPWTTVEAIYRRRLEELLPHYGLEGLGDADLARLTEAWWRLHPWPDAVPGLRRLRARFILSPLSNGSFAGTRRISRGSRGYRGTASSRPRTLVATSRDPKVHRTAVTLLGLRADEVMMVAAHNYDLHAARACGLRTAFVPRQAEHGPGSGRTSSPTPAGISSPPTSSTSLASSRRESTGAVHGSSASVSPMSDFSTPAAYGGAGWSPRTTSLRDEIGRVWGACGLHDE